MANLDILTLSESFAWQKVIEGMPRTDLSATPEYCRVFEENGDGEALCICFQDDAGRIVYPVFRRSLNKLPFVPTNQRDSADICTPYGYGGIYADCTTGDAGELMRRFRLSLNEYAADTGVVSEFIRFHPILENHRHCQGHIDGIRHHNDNVVLDLKLSLDDMLAGCRQSFRSGIRQTESRGFHMERVEHRSVMDEFVSLYQLAMRRRRNTGYLNFHSTFFRRLFDNLANTVELFVVREAGCLLAGAVVLKYGDTIDYFLAANKRFPDLAYINHFLLFEIARWAKQQKFNAFHLGGGAESILFFKSGFSKKRRGYHVGRHIFDKNGYRDLVAAGQRVGLIPDTIPEFFFPAYRAYSSPQADRALLDMLRATPG